MDGGGATGRRGGGIGRDFIPFGDAGGGGGGGGIGGGSGAGGGDGDGDGITQMAQSGSAGPASPSQSPSTACWQVSRVSARPGARRQIRTVVRPRLGSTLSTLQGQHERSVDGRCEGNGISPRARELVLA